MFFSWRGNFTAGANDLALLKILLSLLRSSEWKITINHSPEVFPFRRHFQQLESFKLCVGCRDENSDTFVCVWLAFPQQHSRTHAQTMKKSIVIRFVRNGRKEITTFLARQKKIIDYAHVQRNECFCTVHCCVLIVRHFFVNSFSSTLRPQTAAFTGFFFFLALCKQILF